MQHRAAEPPYRQLAAILRAQVERGDYGANNPLPSERTLMERYGLARTTVRRAIDLLVDEGCVYRAHGRGTYPTET